MSVVTIQREGGVAWVRIDNPPVNATSTAVRAGLMDAVAQVQGLDRAILVCAGRTFVAGGNMIEFDAPPQEPHLPDVVDAISNSATPFVAALHGNVLGGGLEIAMACNARIATPDTRFGLPEVNVGLIPGAGGSQRAPRLFGWDIAVEMACHGRLITAKQAHAAGAIDAISTDPAMAAVSLHLGNLKPVAHRTIAAPDTAWINQTRAKVTKAARGRAAPLHNLDALLWASQPYATAQPKERAQHLAMRASDESRALRHMFFAERATARPAQIAAGTPRDISRVAIVGGGLMGAGIATACLLAGLSTTIIERDADAANAAMDRVTDLLSGALQRGKIDASKHAAITAAFSTATDYNAAHDADLAIEAVFEDLPTKQTVMASLAGVMRTDALLATNTSYLDPNRIFAGIPHPARCLGLHFFAPAHIMKLLEVIALPDTAPDMLASAFDYGKRLRKTAVLSGICDGFIGNRILTAYRRGAEYMLADGATPAQIDTAMRAFGMAMGPFEAQDMSGLQIAQANRRRQDGTRPNSERYVPIADQLCDLGRFGQRMGQGWYRYPDGARTPTPDPEVDALIAAYATSQGIKRRQFETAEIQTRLIALQANEGARIVEEGIAENDATVDVVKVHGYGFPRWRGGPMHMADTYGTDIIRAALDAADRDSPGSWVRAQRYR